MTDMFPVARDGSRAMAMPAGQSLMQITDSASLVRDLARVLRKRAFTIITLVIVTMGLTGIVSLSITPTYEANGSLFAGFGREYVYRAEFGQQSWAPFRSAELLNSELEILNGRSLKEEVVAKMGAHTIYPDLAPEEPGTATGFSAVVGGVVKSLKGLLREEKDPSISGISRAQVVRDTAVREMMKDLRIRSPKDSNVIHIAFRHPDPVIAAAVIANLIDAYFNQRLSLFKDSRGEVIKAEAARHQQALDQARDELERYKAANGISDLDAQVQNGVRRESEISTAIQMLKTEIDVLQERAASLRNPGKSLDGGLANSPLVDPEALRAASVQMLQLQLQEQELLASVGPRNPQLVRVQQSMAAVRDFLETQRQAELARVGAELRAKKTHIGALQQSQKEIQEQLLVLNAHAGVLARLRLTVDQSARNLETFAQKTSEVSLEGALNERRLMSVRILEQPSTPLKRVDMSTGMRVGIAGFAAMLFSIVLAAFLDRRSGGGQSMGVAYAARPHAAEPLEARTQAGDRLDAPGRITDIEEPSKTRLSRK
ncbi:GumC family protein [Indioceanicola profundi]|uniref:GumC family protein n=1 Tax=Indioceanicola profundi TaxID=2220096 RepID=UPI0013C4C80F|nr:hypothetical protein [Indioceanicola profundi]